MVFTKLHAGGKFGGGSYTATGGLHGVGASVVNALSSRLDVEVDRSPATQGDVASSAACRACSPATGPAAAFEPGSGLRKGGRVKKGVTGTRIRFWPDRQIFTKDAALRLGRAGHPGPADLVHRARPRAGAHRPARPPSRSTESFRHDGGITEFCEFLGHDEPVTDVLRLQGSDRFTETVPLLDDEGPHDPAGRRARADRRRRAAVGDRATRPRLRSFVNVIATPKGGTHVAGFEARADQDLQRRACAAPACSRPTTPT